MEVGNTVFWTSIQKTQGVNDRSDYASEEWKQLHMGRTPTAADNSGTANISSREE